jgi:hypothetical protein
MEAGCGGVGVATGLDPSPSPPDWPFSSVSFPSAAPCNRQVLSIQYTPYWGVGRGADMSLAGFHHLWHKILSQNPHAVADQEFHLEGSSPYKGTAYREEY